MTAAARAGGTVSRCRVTATGRSLTWAASTACGVAPVNGGRPVSIS